VYLAASKFYISSLKLQSQRLLDANHCILDVKHTDVPGGTKCVTKFAGEVGLQGINSHRFLDLWLNMCYFTDAGRRHDHLAFSMETVIRYMYMLLGRRIQSASWRHSTEVTRHVCNSG